MKKVTREQAVRALKEHGSYGKAEKALGMARTTFQRLVRTAPLEVAEVGKSVSGKKLSDFREKYDKSYFIPKKVKAALVKLGNGWEYEADFAHLAGIGLADLSTVREQFLDYVVTIGRDSRRAWTGSKTVAEQMRRMI